MHVLPHQAALSSYSKNAQPLLDAEEEARSSMRLK